MGDVPILGQTPEPEEEESEVEVSEISRQLRRLRISNQYRVDFLSQGGLGQPIQILPQAFLEIKLQIFIDSLEPEEREKFDLQFEQRLEKQLEQIEKDAKKAIAKMKSDMTRQALTQGVNLNISPGVNHGK